MRKIFPENNDIIGLQDESTRPVTQQDLVNIQAQIEQVATDLSNAVNSLENYKTSQSQHISTNLVDAVNAAITTLQATNANLANASIGTLTVSQLNELENLVARVAAFTSMTTTDATVTNTLAVNKVNANDITVEDLKATNAQITNWSITNLGVDSVIANTINTQNVNTTNVLSENENTQNLNVSTKATIKEAEIEAADISGLKSDKIETSVINWKDYTTIVDPDVYYIKVPHFTNGHYFIEGRSNGEKLFNIEVTNSLSNYTINWGKKDDQKWIEEVYIDETLGNVWIKANTLEKTIDLYYSNINSDCNESPATYNDLPITPDETYPIVYRNGSKFFGPVDLMDNRNFEPLDLSSTSDYSQASDAVHYTVTEPEEFKVYLPDQSLNKDDSVEFYETKTTFLNVRDFRTLNFVASELEDETDIDLTEFDDGALVVIRADKDDPYSTAYIKRTLNNTPVLYKLVTVNGMPAIRTNHPVVWDPTIQCLVDTGEIAVDSLQIGHIDGNLHVTGDLIVDGTTHTVDVEEVAATGDILTLRANNANPLASTQVSGLVINKYDGVKDLALGTSSDGTLRVGTATGTDVSYTNIALKYEDNLYYSYDNLLPPNYTLLNPQPQGTMTSWTGKAEVDGYTKYATAVFTQIDITTMQPVLTREESQNMTNAMPLVWDAANSRAVDVPSGTYNIFATEGDNIPKWVHRDNVYVGQAGWATNQGFNYQNIDLTSLDQNTWYPVTIELDRNVPTNIYCCATLDSGNHPSWATHQSGFTAVCHIVGVGGGWGNVGEGLYEIMYNWQGFHSGEAPVGWQWNSSSSWFIFWLRGGAVYPLANDRAKTFTLHTGGATAANGQVYNPASARITSLPVSTIIAHLDGNATTATNATNANNANLLDGLDSLQFMHHRTSDVLTTNELQAEIVNNGSAGPCCGSCDITDGPRGNAWYNFIFIPHRDGIGQDSYLFGTLIAFSMTDNVGDMYLKHLINGSWNGWIQVHAGTAGQAVLAEKIRVGTPTNPTAGDIWVD